MHLSAPRSVPASNAAIPRWDAGSEVPTGDTTSADDLRSSLADPMLMRADPPNNTTPQLQPPAVHWINCQWLLRLRMVSLIGQLVTILVVHVGMGIRLPLGFLFLLIALATATTIAAWIWLRSPDRDPPGLLPALMVHDVLHLTGLLYLTGGPLNPFSFLYLVLIALSAVSMTPRFTWALASLSAACSALLFLWHRPLPLSHAEQMQLHLPGMWVAFAVAAAFIVYFLMRVTHALRQREHELEAARNLALRRERLASLATLAAGAAHELGSPLSTIAVVAKDLLRQPRCDQESLHADLELISASVARCRHVLSQMATDAGQNPGENMTPFSVWSWLHSAREGLADKPAIDVLVSPGVAGRAVFGPQRALTQALSALLKNAQDASPTSGTVSLTAMPSGQRLCIRVSDRGSGMTEATLRHAGEPFFTTKPPGRGMGLGLFLCREVVESMGGTLHIHSDPGIGTAVTLLVPMLPVVEGQP